MSCKMISSGNHTSALCANLHYPTKKSMLESHSHISFTTHFTKPSLSIEIPSGSHRKRTSVAAINAFYSPENKPETFYELLGISESGNLSDIKRAYKQLARKYHPDVSPPDRVEEYTEKFIRVQEAYQTLSDPQTRALYDRDLDNSFHLAFSSRKYDKYSQRINESGECKNRWQTQIMELERRSINKQHARGNDSVSWAARIRRERNEMFELGFD